MEKRRSLLLTLVPALISVLALASCGDDDDPAPPPAPEPAPAPQAKTCDTLNGIEVAAASIGLPTTGAVVTGTEIVEASGFGPIAVGEYCKVLGDINPVDPNAPKIKFQVNLPASWNGKAMMFGGTGFNGTIVTGTDNVPAGPLLRQVPLGLGYATFGSDSGHQAGPAGGRDGSFGVDDEALRNFAGDALKKTRDVAIEIIKERYAAQVRLTYFAGGSTGGGQALLAVGRWPEDFDGAIVLYPALKSVALSLHFGRMTRELAKPGAYPSRLKRKLILDAALETCDALDGASDRLISNVAACDSQFSPEIAMLNGAPLRCSGGGDAGDFCLSDAQIEAFKVIHSPTVLSYTLASGENDYPGFTTWGTDFGVPSLIPFQETVLTLGLGTVAPASPMPPVTERDSPPYGSTSWDQSVKYFVTRDPQFDSLTLDPQNPGPWQPRIFELSALLEGQPSDFSAFYAKGGKILIAHGAHDGLASNRATRQWLNRVRNTMGPANVDGFLRYYEIPGFGHGIGTVFNASWDSLTALENWVELGVAPTDLVVLDTLGVPGRRRPLCDYPTWPRYNGSGDVDAATSFTCVTE